MPVTVKIIKSTKATVILHKCELCSRWACFGIDVKYGLALLELDKKQHEAAIKHLGRWYCGEHQPA